MGSKLDKYTDPELFELVQSKGELANDAFSLLYDRHSPRVFAYCRRFLGNKEEAQDILQETFIRLYKSADSERDMTNVPAFILTIARNLCVNLQKKRKPEISYEDYMIVREDYDKDEDELLELIRTALELLSDEYREVFILREYEGLSYQDIADVTNSSLSNVKVRIYSAKQIVKDILAHYLVVGD
jgi:RNA polymerase sigma-70 factor (ECF subfamily)